MNIKRILKLCFVLTLSVIMAVSSPLGVLAAYKATALADNDKRIDIINSAELSAKSPKSQELDAYLDELLQELVNEDMTTYEQVKACYDYLYTNIKYGSHTKGLPSKLGNTTCRDIYRSYGEVEGFGAVALVTKQGLCNAYAAAFILMTRKLGLDSYLVRGYTKSRGGSYTYHEWAEMKINGKIYLFDPQLEQNLTTAGLPKYSVFCRTYDGVSGRYRKNK